MANNYIKTITDYKKQWQDATNAGDTKTADKVAANAQKVYQQMRAAGMTTEADKLQSSNYDGAVKYQDAYNTDGKVSTRDYAKSTLSKYGYNYSPDDFSYNEGNDNVSFKGINLGKADYVSSDGKSYYDPKVLEGKSKDIASILGMSANDKTAYGTNRDKMFSEYENALGIAKNTNPFETETGKSIMESYGIKGNNAAANGVATVAGENGGNIDSFAAANAKNQLLSYKNAGQQAVLADHNSRIANISGILSNLGVAVQNTFGNSEASLNNQTARDTQVSGVTGYNSGSIATASNPYFNSDGTLKAPDTDFQEIINNAPDETTKQNAIQARAYKVTLPKYSQYAATATSVAPAKTAAQKAQDDTVALTREGYTSNQAIAGINAASNANVAGINAGANMYASDNSVLAAGGKLDNKSLITAYDSSVKNINDMYNKEDVGKEENEDVLISDGNGNYRFNPKVDKSAYTDLIIKYMGNNSALSSDEAKQFLYSLGITDADISRVANQLKE